MFWWLSPIFSWPTTLRPLILKLLRCWAEAFYRTGTIVYNFQAAERESESIERWTRCWKMPQVGACRNVMFCHQYHQDLKPCSCKCLFTETVPQLVLDKSQSSGQDEENWTHLNGDLLEALWRQVHKKGNDLIVCWIQAKQDIQTRPNKIAYRFYINKRPRGSIWTSVIIDLYICFIQFIIP